MVEKEAGVGRLGQPMAALAGSHTWQQHRFVVWVRSRQGMARRYWRSHMYVSEAFDEAACGTHAMAE
eukprot:1189542-Prorocentrum_minimum.AAC.4